MALVTYNSLTRVQLLVHLLVVDKPTSKESLKESLREPLRRNLTSSLNFLLQRGYIEERPNGFVLSKLGRSYADNAPLSKLNLVEFEVLFTLCMSKRISFDALDVPKLIESRRYFYGSVMGAVNSLTTKGYLERNGLTLTISPAGSSVMTLE